MKKKFPVQSNLKSAGQVWVESALCGLCALLHITTNNTLLATAHCTLHTDTLPHTVPCVARVPSCTLPHTEHCQPQHTAHFTQTHYHIQCPMWPVCLLRITTHSTSPGTGHSTLYTDTLPHTMPCVVCAALHTASCTTHSLHCHA